MRHIYLFAVIVMTSMAPIIASAQTDTIPKSKTDTTAKALVDTATAANTTLVATTAVDTTAQVKASAETEVIATPMNCYKQYVDYFTELGTKPITDGIHPVVIAFKSKESCNCFMGRVEVSGGKIKSPVYVQTEGGEYKTFTALGKKLDADFLAAQGDGIWSIANGMSVVFQTTDNEYGRIFFYKFLNKNKNMNKEAPSPADLLK